MLVATVTRLDEIALVEPLADLIEIRLDFLPDLSFLKKGKLPLIFTFRKKSQGGVCDLPEAERLNQIERALELKPAYCDLEADTDVSFIEHIAKKFPQTQLIGSYHNFEETPGDLEGLLASMKHPCFSLYKIALKANSTLDMLRLMIFAREKKGPLSVISMGEYGKPSRVLAPIMGSVLDYAGLQEDQELHRYSLQTLLETFHYRNLSRDTLIYALIGNPVAQSPGDVYHNGQFKKNAVYVKMALGSSEIYPFFQLIRKLPFGGLSVTIPLKEAVSKQMDQVDPAAEAIGAVNTVTFREGKLVGTNTDAPGALNAMEKHLSVQGKRLAILGAGGTARAIAYEAKQRGASVAIFNRTLGRAETLAKRFGGRGFTLDQFSPESYDILVNTIPPKEAKVPPLRSGLVVMDVVYFPKETPLLRAALQRGCLCIYGEEMFVEQAKLQQREWN